MRFFVLFTLVCTQFFLSGCQTSYANGGYRGQTSSAWSQNQSTRAIHHRGRIPQQAHTLYKANQAALIPARPLLTPTTPAPKPGCAAVCVIDPRTGKVLYQHNAHQRRQVASTQKLVTALCVCDAGDLNDEVTIERSDVQTPRIRLDLKPGTTYTRYELLKVMLTGSYNDIAKALARDVAGSQEQFAARMNARARRMRMRNSHFVNPSGLPGAQYSTAYDMALAACHAYVNPVIRSCINVPRYDFVREDGSLRSVSSTNRLLRSGAYPWIHGMKTGYTDAAGKCLISCGAREGRAVIVVVLGSTNARVWNESLKYLKWALRIA